MARASAVRVLYDRILKPAVMSYSSQFLFRISIHLKIRQNRPQNQ